MATLNDVEKLVAELPEQQRRVFYDRQAVLKTAALVRDLRARSGLSQVELARRVGTTQSYISDLENGNGRLGPSYALLLSIAKACDDDLVLMSESKFTDSEKAHRESAVRLRGAVRGVKVLKPGARLAIESAGEVHLVPVAQPRRKARIASPETIYNMQLPKGGASALLDGELVTIHELTLSKGATTADTD